MQAISFRPNPFHANYILNVYNMSYICIWIKYCLNQGLSKQCRPTAKSDHVSTIHCNFDGSNTDGTFTTAISNLSLSPRKMLL